MQVNRKRGRCGHAPVQRAVMALTLDAFPRWYRIKDLKREIGCGGVPHTAVRDLIAFGLLEREGSGVRPTKPIVHYENLMLP